MVTAAILVAVGILIPVISPVKIQLGAMSFTLASHVAIFIAMFISPYVTLFVTLGTTVGFLFAGFPMVVVLRALSQVVFAMVGSALLKKNADKYMGSPSKIFMFGLFVNVIHALGEVLVVTGFYFGGMAVNGTFLSYVCGLVGLGTLVHGMVDYGLSLLIWKAVYMVSSMPASWTPKKKK